MPKRNIKAILIEYCSANKPIKGGANNKPKKLMEEIDVICWFILSLPKRARAPYTTGTIELVPRPIRKYPISIIT